MFQGTLLYQRTHTVSKLAFDFHWGYAKLGAHAWKKTLKTVGTIKVTIIRIHFIQLHIVLQR